MVRPSLFLLMLMLCPAAVADETDVSPSHIEDARRHFLAGRRAYLDGRYRDALKEFQVGYGISPRPEFLLNFAQTYRKLGRYDDAIHQCDRFLAAEPSSLQLLEEARALLRDLRREREHAPPQPPEPPSPLPVPPPAVVPPLVAPPAVAQPAIVAAPPPRRTPRRHAWVWITAGSAVLVTAAGAVVLGVTLAPRQGSLPSSALGTVSFVP